MVLELVARKPWRRVARLGALSTRDRLWSSGLGILLESLADDAVVPVLHVEDLFRRIVHFESQPLVREVHAVHQRDGYRLSLWLHHRRKFASEE